MDAAAFTAILARHGVRHGTGVPCSFFTALVDEMVADPALDYLPAASEGEAVALAAGMIAAGLPTYALMQNSGLGNAVNPLTSLIDTYAVPALLFVSHRGAPGLTDAPQHTRMGAITEGLMSKCGLRTHRFDEAAFEAELAAARRDGAPTGWLVPKGAITGQQPPPPPPPDVALPARPSATASSFRARVPRRSALDALRRVMEADGAPPAVVATTGKTSRELFALTEADRERPHHFYMVGSMGCAAAFGLGVARGTDRAVVVLDGDGSALMKLGTLATIGAAAPTNLHHVILDNGVHDSTGAQPTVSPGVDFAAAALACGYRRAATVADPARFGAALAAHLRAPGPSLLRLLITPGSAPDLGRPTLSPPGIFARFSRWLRDQPA